MITKIDQRLHHASRIGNLNEIKKILEEHYPGEKTSEIVNAKDEDGYTPLTYVILSNQIDVSKKKEIIAYLISQDADVNVIDNRDFDLIFLLIDNIYSIHRDEKIETNEKYRAINEQIDFAKYFIEQYKPDVLHKTEDIRKKQRTVGNLLEKIVRDAPVNFFDFLMESYPELLTAKQRNNSLLTYAEIEDDSKLLENIYNRIAKDPNHLKAYIRETNWSAENLMHLKKILKISSANPIDTKQVFTEVTSTIQDNPLHKLILYQVTLYSNTSALDITNAVKFLVEQSPALLYQKNSRGQTPIDAAFDERNLSILSILMEIDFPEESIKRYCSSIDWTKNEEIDFMAKILVLMAKNPSRMLLLWEGIPPQKRQRVLNTEVGGIVAQESLNHLQDRLDVNPVPANTVYGINGTQLHFLVMEGTEDEVANFIKDTNADVNSKDKRGKTPLHYAMQRGELVIIEQLLSHSQIDVNAKDHDGNSILHDAVKYNSPLLKLIEQAKKLKTPPLDKIEIYVFNNELKSVIDMTYEDTFKTVAKDYLLFDEIQSVNLQRDLFKAEKRKIKKEIVDQGPYKPLDSSKQEHTVPEIFESGLFFQDKSKESFFHGKAAELYESEIVRPLMNLIAMAIKGYYDKEKVESRFKSIISSGEHALGSFQPVFLEASIPEKIQYFLVMQKLMAIMHGPSKYMRCVILLLIKSSKILPALILTKTSNLQNLVQKCIQ